jgi:hypothetical protein
MPDHQMIRNIVEGSLALATGANAVDQLFDAWSHTRNLRENGACGDENLAVAEHYLYARYFVAEGGYTAWVQMQALIGGYNALKAYGLRGLLPETGVCKVTPFSRADVDWSFRGADDGLEDYRKGSKSPQKLKTPDLPL